MLLINEPKKWSRRAKIIRLLIVVPLIALWFSGLWMSVNGTVNAINQSEKKVRNVVMLDAWSYSSGNSRDRYEGLYQIEGSEVTFVYDVSSYNHHLFVKNGQPIRTSISVSDRTTGERSHDRNDVFFAVGSLFMLFIIGLMAGALQASFTAHRRGWVYDLVMDIYYWNASRKEQAKNLE